jgi:hypothetical protein
MKRTRSFAAGSAARSSATWAQRRASGVGAQSSAAFGEDVAVDAVGVGAAVQGVQRQRGPAQVFAAPGLGDPARVGGGALEAVAQSVDVVARDEADRSHARGEHRIRRGGCRRGRWRGTAGPVARGREPPEQRRSGRVDARGPVRLAIVVTGATGDTGLPGRAVPWDMSSRRDAVRHAEERIGTRWDIRAARGPEFGPPKLLAAPHADLPAVVGIRARAFTR